MVILKVPKLLCSWGVIKFHQCLVKICAENVQLFSELCCDSLGSIT